MKKLIIYPLALCGMLLTQQGVAQMAEAVQSQRTQEMNKWVEIKNENGLKISLKDEVLASVRFISIHFENNSNKEISFSWELNQGGKLIKSNDSTNRVRPNGGTLIIDSKSGIKLLSSDLITDFDVNIILK